MPLRFLPTPVELSFPGDERFVEMAQLVASSVATICGLPFEEVEDFRLLVDEICDAVLGTASGAPVRLAFRMADDRLVVEASTDAGEQPQADRLALGNELLDILTDAHERVIEHGRLRYTASRDLRAGGVG